MVLWLNTYCIFAVLYPLLLNPIKFSLAMTTIWTWYVCYQQNTKQWSQFTQPERHDILMHRILKCLMGQEGDLEFHNHPLPSSCSEPVEQRTSTEKITMDKEIESNVFDFHLCFLCFLMPYKSRIRTHWFSALSSHYKIPIFSMYLPISKQSSLSLRTLTFISWSQLWCSDLFCWW